jgi:hypothetical protein
VQRKKRNSRKSERAFLFNKFNDLQLTFCYRFVMPRNRAQPGRVIAPVHQTQVSFSACAWISPRKAERSGIGGGANSMSER